jgi:hypothetical protein
MNENMKYNLSIHNIHGIVFGDKNNKALIHIATCMNLVKIILSGRNTSHKALYNILTFI